MFSRILLGLVAKTRLERRCRLLAVLLILGIVTCLTWIFIYQSEAHAYDSDLTACGMLVRPILVKEHLPHLEWFNVKKEEDTKQLSKFENAGIEEQLEEYPFQYRLIKKGEHEDAYEEQLFDRFYYAYKSFSTFQTGAFPAHRLEADGRVLVYYSGIRASDQCLACHAKIAEEDGQEPPAENDLLAMLRIRKDTSDTVLFMLANRFYMIRLAMVVVLISVVLSWLFIRFMIVRPELPKS
jgi:hypothetical protein